MVNYIKELLRSLGNFNSRSGPLVVKDTLTELDRLDPRDFSPDVQSEFVLTKSLLRRFAGEYIIRTGSGWSSTDVNKNAETLFVCLGSYLGEGSYRKTREFLFITDTDLRNIIKRDYVELRTILFPAGAWKSVVIISGSILEAILFDALTKDAATKGKATSSTKAPKGAIDDWGLFMLIEVATDIGIFSSERANTIDQVLRDYRNFVHPKKEIRAAHPCSEAEAFLAIGALDGVCNHLE